MRTKHPRKSLPLLFLFLRYTGDITGNTKVNTPVETEVFTLVSLIESNWNLICSEILRWVEILKGGQWSLALPA